MKDLVTFINESSNQIYEHPKAKDYDNGDGKIGNYAKPQHIKLNSKELYNKLKNNRHYQIKYGLPEKEIIDKLYSSNLDVKISQHKNADTTEIYRIDFSKNPYFNL